MTDIRITKDCIASVMLRDGSMQLITLNVGQEFDVLDDFESAVYISYNDIGTLFISSKFAEEFYFKEKGQLELQEIIDILEKTNPYKTFRNGFCDASSYRGIYANVGFIPKSFTTAREMLDCAKDAIGRYFPGYKSGEFEMKEDTPCHYAHRGYEGKIITKEFFEEK